MEKTPLMMNCRTYQIFATDDTNIDMMVPFLY
jgi:hypothetical protein